MGDFGAIYEWLKNNCPALYNLWVASSLLADKKNIIQPKTSANMYDVIYEQYSGGEKRYLFKPTEPYYFDVDIICYREFYADQNTDNLYTLEDMQAVCDWLIKQQNEGNVPEFKDYPCYQIECLSARPFIRNEFVRDDDPNTILVDYAVTVRFYTVNPAVKRVVIK